LVVEFFVPLLVLVYDLVALVLGFCLRVLVVVSLAASLSLVDSMQLDVVFCLVLVEEYDLELVEVYGSELDEEFELVLVVVF